MTEAIFSYEPQKFSEFEELIEIALDLRWSWNHGADDIWRPLDPELWDLTRNPWVILETASPEKVEQLSADEDFRARVGRLARILRRSRSEPGWFQKACQAAPLQTVAYFSMEFMLGEALPIYSGGLGNVAGDQLKAASDLGVPVVGVGLLYQEGYFRQSIAADGSQSALYPYNDPGQLQITPARNGKGEWIRLLLRLSHYEVWARAWQAQVGRVRLYLLDTNDPANPPLTRGITSQLYGGGHEVRLAQEIVLGLGGWRLLRALDLQPEVCHLNEGHAAFAVLERAADYMRSTGLSFDTALHVTKAGNLFTTHTPVAAGFDRFSPEEMRKFLARYATEQLNIPFEDLLALGRLNPRDETEPFNMAYLAVRGSGAINGVSRLHGKVSRRIFQPLFERWPEDEIPVGHVTNGIHVPTWDSAHSDALWTRQCGGSRWVEDLATAEKAVRETRSEELWDMRTASRRTLVEYARSRYSRQLMVSGQNLDDGSPPVLDPEALTLGFARRFVSYKRPTLLLHDSDRLIRILTDPNRPVQLIVAGKAHPADAEGQEMIREWVRFTKRPEIHGRVVFLSDYDMILTEQMVGGVDVWINTPRRPWEACGTSGMKVLANGGLNLSELDGWWAEAYSPEVGWAIGDGQEHDNEPDWDRIEAEQLYALLENEIIPEFYDRGEDGVPTGWVARIRQSMADLTMRFSAHRAVKEYTKELYLPAAATYEIRRANGGQRAMDTIDRLRALQNNWGSMSFLGTSAETLDGQHYFRTVIDFGNVNPEWVLVELYAYVSGGSPFRQAMNLENGTTEGKNVRVYISQVRSTQPAANYTPRIIPSLPGLATPLELDLILWQR